jgi:hypothetical protein
MAALAKFWVPPEKKSQPRPAGLLPQHPPVSPNNNSPFQLKTYVGSTTSGTLFDDSAPPDYEEAQDGDQPPSFSEVSLTLNTAGNLVQPVSMGPPLNQAIPLYSLSPSLFDREAVIITVDRLYHRVTENGIRETVLPVYGFHRFLSKYRIQPLITSARHFNWIHGERYFRLSGPGWKFAGEVTVKGDYVEKQLFSVERGKGCFEWIDAEGEVVAYESVLRNGAFRNEKSMEGSGTGAAGAMAKAISMLGKHDKSDEGKAASSIHDEPSMPMLKIIKSLGKDELDLLITAWCVKIWDS